MDFFPIRKDGSKHTAYDFAFTTLTGVHPLPLSQFKGKVLLVVNTASECGFTPQYKGLETLYRKYEARGFVVLGVPCNDFGAQEPDGGEAIQHFCQMNYKISFPLTEKEHVRGGDAHPFYRWISSQTGFFGRPRWNFYKYLIDRHGRLAACFSSITTPQSPRLQKAIEAELDKS